MHSSSKKVFFKKWIFKVYENVYEPAEDSFLFANNLTVNKEDTVLDIGTGCGILGIIAAEKASKVIATDINPYAIRCAKENAKLNKVENKIFFIQGDLFKPIKHGEKFDLILFNAPYLPSEKTETKSWIEHAWTGGILGREIIDQFIHYVPFYLKKDGYILLMQSTISNVKKTLKEFKKHGLESNIIAEQDLPFFETIVLVKASFKD